MLPTGIVDIDGALCPADDAKISVFDRGFLYGDSVFEVMRTYGRRAFEQRAHLQRLARSCERMQIALPVALETLAERVERAIEASGLPECSVRVVVTRGAGPMGLDIGEDYVPSVLVYALALHPPAASTYEQGIEVGLVHTLRAVDSTPAAGAKTSNYLASMLALQSVKQRGAKEAIIVDAQGDIIEGATSNLFIVQDGVLLTPPESAGILEGITRRTVFALGRELGIAVQERALRADDLYAASEAFITSSIRELVAVVRADGRVIGAGQPGPIYRALLTGYRARAAATDPRS